MTVHLGPILILMFALVSGSNLSFATTHSFSISVVIRQGISTTKTSDLSFGTIELSDSSAAFKVSASPGPHSAGAGAVAAQFTVTKDPGASGAVSVTRPIVVTTGRGKLLVMPSTNITSFPAGGGPQTIFVGGAVMVTGSSINGVYSGTGTLTVLFL